MSGKGLEHIACAVRGGIQSRETVTRAVDLALENSALLTFFHVMDAEFLQHATIGPLSVVYQELVEMGNFTMVILCDRARRRGVAEVDYVVREGNIRRQLLQAAIETHAELLVIGRPAPSSGRSVFKADEVDGFAAELERLGNIRVLTV